MEFYIFSLLAFLFLAFGIKLLSLLFLKSKNPVDMEIAIVGASGVGKTSNLAHLLDRLNLTVKSQEKIVWACWLDEEEEKSLRNIEEWAKEPGKRQTRVMVESVLSQESPTLMPEDCYVKILHHENGNPISYTVRFRDIPGRHFERVSDWIQEQNMLKKHLQESSGIILYVDASCPPDAHNREMWYAYAQAIAQFTKKNKNYPVWFCLTKVDKLSDAVLQETPQNFLQNYGQRLSGLLSMMKVPKFFTFNTIRKDHKIYENSGNTFLSFYLEAVQSLKYLRRQNKKNLQRLSILAGILVLSGIFFSLEAWEYQKFQAFLKPISLDTLCQESFLEKTTKFLEKAKEKKEKWRFSIYSYSLFMDKIEDLIQQYEQYLDRQFYQKIGIELEEKQFALEIMKPIKEEKEFLRELQEKQNFLEIYAQHKNKIRLFFQNMLSQTQGDYRELTELLKATKEYEQKPQPISLLYLTKKAIYCHIFSNSKESKNFYLVGMLRYIRLQWEKTATQNSFVELLSFQRQIMEEISQQQIQGQKEIADGLSYYKKQMETRLESLWRQEWEKIREKANKMSPRWQEQPKNKLQEAWKSFFEDSIKSLPLNMIPDTILKEFTTEILQSWTALQQAYIIQGNIDQMPVSQHPYMQEYKNFLQGVYIPESEKEIQYEDRNIYSLLDRKDKLSMQEKMLFAFYTMVYSIEIFLDVKQMMAQDYEKKIEILIKNLERSLSNLALIPDAEKIWKQRVEELKSLTSTRDIEITFPPDAFQCDVPKPVKEDCDAYWYDETFERYVPYLRILVTADDKTFVTSSVQSFPVMWNPKSTILIQWMDDDNGYDGKNLNGDDDIMKSMSAKVFYSNKYIFRKDKFRATLSFHLHHPAWIQAYLKLSDN